jgi:uncharacterized protein
MSTAGSAGLRVVLDTNIYVSAFSHRRGAPFYIWLQAVEGRYALLISPPIVAEIARVLRRKFLWDDTRIVHVVKFIAKVAEIVTPEAPLRVIEDEADNRILECAVAGRADLIVSGDHHLSRLKSFRGIGIIRPVDFQRILRR